MYKQPYLNRDQDQNIDTKHPRKNLSWIQEILRGFQEKHVVIVEYDTDSLRIQLKDKPQDR